MISSLLALVLLTLYIIPGVIIGGFISIELHSRWTLWRIDRKMRRYEQDQD